MNRKKKLRLLAGFVLTSSLCLTGCSDNTMDSSISPFFTELLHASPKSSRERIAIPVGDVCQSVELPCPVALPICDNSICTTNKDLI